MNPPESTTVSLDKIKKVQELKTMKLETEKGNIAAKSVFLPYKYLSKVKGKGLRSKMISVSEFL